MKKKYLSGLIKYYFVLMANLTLAHADPIDDYLTYVEEQFDKASTPTKKYKVISAPLNLEYLRELEDIKKLDKKKLYFGVSSHPVVHTNDKREKYINLSKTTAISLAVSRGKEALVRKFLTAVRDPNAPELTAWGYRQPYTLAHMALDPQYPRAFRKVALESRLGIIDALGEREANFNSIIPHTQIGIYANPPLAAGWPSGYHFQDIIDHVRARALLYGADPDCRGSSFSGIMLKNETKLLDFC